MLVAYSGELAEMYIYIQYIVLLIQLNDGLIPCPLGKHLTMQVGTRKRWVTHAAQNNQDRI